MYDYSNLSGYEDALERRTIRLIDQWFTNVERIMRVHREIVESVTTGYFDILRSCR